MKKKLLIPNKQKFIFGQKNSAIVLEKKFFSKNPHKNLWQKYSQSPPQSTNLITRSIQTPEEFQSRHQYYLKRFFLPIKKPTTSSNPSFSQPKIPHPSKTPPPDPSNLITQKLFTSNKRFISENSMSFLIKTPTPQFPKHHPLMHLMTNQSQFISTRSSRLKSLQKDHFSYILNFHIRKSRKLTSNF